jgi:hypothetical protein
LEHWTQLVTSQPSDEGERPTWAYWLNERELDVMEGRCLTELDRPDPAAPRLLDALDGYNPAIFVRWLCTTAAWLGEACKAGDVDQAYAETMRVLG